MKKNYFFTVLITLFTGLSFAQGSLEISFESDENYTLNPLAGQNGWATNATYSPFILVTDEEASDGTQSLLLQGDPNGPIPGGAITGALLPINDISGDFSFSTDMFVESGNGTNESEVNIIIQSFIDGFVTARIAFFDGSIFILTTDPEDPTTLFFDNVGTHPLDTWFEFEIDFQFTDGNIVYSVDDSVVLTGGVLGTVNVDQFLLYSSFNQTGVYFDKIKFEEENLSVSTQDALDFTVYPNPTSEVLFIESPSNVAIERVDVFHINGKKQEVEFAANQVDVRNLTTGHYLLRVQTELGHTTMKFIKQ